VLPAIEESTTAKLPLPHGLIRQPLGRRRSFSTLRGSPYDAEGERFFVDAVERLERFLAENFRKVDERGP